MKMAFSVKTRLGESVATAKAFGPVAETEIDLMKETFD
jgi:hypothetical protein